MFIKFDNALISNDTIHSIWHSAREKCEKNKIYEITMNTKYVGSGFSEQFNSYGELEARMMELQDQLNDL